MGSSLEHASSDLSVGRTFGDGLEVTKCLGHFPVVYAHAFARRPAIPVILDYLVPLKEGIDHGVDWVFPLWRGGRAFLFRDENFKLFIEPLMFIRPVEKYDL